MAKARIMVVEDEGLVAMSIQESLQGMGYDVPVVAMNGEDAVNKLLETEPDLVLMDIQLKGGASGIETARRIRQRLDVPVVFLTAFSDVDTLEQAQLTEPSGYVLKPYDEKSLHAVIQMSLLKHRRTRSVRENGWWMTAVAESMMEAVVICDPKGYIKFANPAAEPLLGQPRSQLLEKRISEVIRLLDADSREAVTFPVSLPLLEGKSTIKANCRVVTAAGTEVPADFSSSPLRSPEGTLFGILYVFRETTERDRVQTLVLRELEELSKVQQRILPSRDTAVPGLRCEWMFLPSTFGCGDALGCLRLDDDHVAFYALDVIGQGIVSAVFSLLLHTFLSPYSDRGGMLVADSRNEPRRRILSPEEVVKELNRRFFLREETNPYFTLVYGVLEPASGVARIVRAGHPFPILQTANGEIRAVKPGGYAVGLFPGADVTAEEIRLSAGDRLFLYSDGLVDCANQAGAPFSTARLTDCIKAGAAAPLAEVVQTIRAEVLRWRGSEGLADDVSLLALEKE
jgi:PAS domain S-box-containing protein